MMSLPALDVMCGGFFDSSLRLYLLHLLLYTDLVTYNSCSLKESHDALIGLVMLDLHGFRKGSNSVLCDVQALPGGIIMPNEAAEAIGNDSPNLGEDAAAGKMESNGIFSLGLLLFRLICTKCHIVEDYKTKPHCVGDPILHTFSSAPFYFQQKRDSFFYLYDYHSVYRLARQCVDCDKCLTISQVIRKLENLLLFSLPVRSSSGKVLVGVRMLVYFTYSDLCELTDKFSEENLFAITQFGESYRGRIQQGWKEAGAQDIIVKMYGELNFTRSSSKRSSVEDNICRLRDEVSLLTQCWMIDKPHVVKLLGYCFEDKKLGAVYSVQPLYTLESLLDDEEKSFLATIYCLLRQWLQSCIAIYH